MLGTWFASVMLTWKELLVNSISYFIYYCFPIVLFSTSVSMLMVTKKQLKGQLVVMHCRLLSLTLYLHSGSLCKRVAQGVKE